MSKVMFYVLVGAAIGYVRSRTKKGRTMAAAKGAALGWLGAAQLAPRLNINLPAPKSLSQG